MMVRNISGLMVAVILVCAMHASSAEHPRFEKLTVKRTELGMIDKQDLFIDCAIHATQNEVYLTLFCFDTADTPGKAPAPEDSTAKQLVPYRVKWLVKDKDGKIIRSWLAYFLENRDGLRHTIVKMPIEELKNSELEVYFETDSHDHRRDLTVTVKCDEFNWEGKNGEWQRAGWTAKR